MKQMAGLSIRHDGTRNREVFLISFSNQRNGRRAFIPSVRHLLRLQSPPRLTLNITFSWEPTLIKRVNLLPTKCRIPSIKLLALGR